MVVRVLGGLLWNLNVSTRRSRDHCLLQSPCQKFIMIDLGRERKVSDRERHVETDSVKAGSSHRNALGVVDGDPLAPPHHPQTGTQCQY